MIAKHDGACMVDDGALIWCLSQRSSEPGKKLTLQWVVFFLAVRDAQDRTAFADLVRHFAPRLKGFD